nr:DUF6443 domain-containing protein [uncultured Pedobacter sp.]
MAIYHITIKSKIMPVLLAFSLLLSAIASMAQTYVNAPMTGTPTAGAYYSNTSIVLSPNFSFTATSGSSLSLYIVSPDCVPQTMALSANKNYMLTSVPRVGGITTIAGLANRSTCELMQTVQYFDGLGRQLQSIQIKGSPLDKDVVQPFVYDVFGREVQKYLPYAATTADGGYKADALTAGAGVLDFYYPAGSTAASGTQQSNGIVYNPKPFAITNFESSPLNRATEQGAPGTDWQPVAGSATSHTVKIVYTVNNTTALTDTANTLIAALYGVTINTDRSRTLTRATDNNANYMAAKLDVGIAKDENWKSGRGGTTETYKDNEGRVVLKRTFNYSDAILQILSTYYVYDDLGNLAFVLPPMSNADNALPIQTVLDNLCYQYRYDELNRLIQKKLPGKGWEYVVYNKLNQPVLTQDAIQRLTNQWAVAKYDALGRIIVTGLWNAGSVIPLDDLQMNVYAGAQWDTRNTANTTIGYTISSYPALSSYLSINYYDDYTFTNISGLPTAFTAAPSGSTVQANGLLTGSKTNILGTTNMLWDVNYYDDLGRSIQSYKQHNLGGGTPNAANYDVITNSYNFTNVLTASTRKHYNSISTANPVVTIANTYAYDHMGRKTQTFEQINGATNVLLSQIDYNELGQPKTKHLHSAAGVAPFLQDISYAYNERGWLQKINDPSVAPTAKQMFAEQLNYNSTQYGVTSQYNGNIASQAYQVYNSPTTGIQTVAYSYDQLSRLKAGASSTGFSETGITYDLMGNITALTRAGAGNGTLAYAYNGNQLSSISGFKAGSYAYDANGNMKTDGLRAATIGYNLLNLPQSVTATGISITYTYDAAGNKLRKVSSGASTDYIGGIQYKADGTIDFIRTEEGRANRSGTNYIYEYTLADHLGNNRVIFDETNGKVGEDDYYPFGLNMHRQQNAGNKYLYNDKEVQEELNVYDYGARFYDPIIGRWGVPDPLQESYGSFSPYAYVLNNPAGSIDIDGLWTQTANGWTSDNAQEAQDFFKGLQIQSNNGGTIQFINGSGIDNEAFRMVSDGGQRNLAQVFYNSDGKKAKPMDGAPEISTGNADNASQPGDDNGSGSRGRVGNALVVGGVSYAALENAVANKYWWLSTKGEYVSTKILQAGSNGKFIRGVQGYRNGFKSALGAAKGYRVAGNIVGGLGIAVTGLQYLNGDITGTEAAFDTAFGVIGFLGPIGAGVSATYFLGKMGYEYFSGKTVFDKPKG